MATVATIKSEINGRRYMPGDAVADADAEAMLARGWAQKTRRPAERLLRAAGGAAGAGC